MAASLAVARGEGAQTFELRTFNPEQFRRARSVMTERLAGGMRPGDVRYLGPREVHSGAGVRIVHVFAVVDVIEKRDGRVFFDGESKGYRPAAKIQCIRRIA